MKRQPEPSLFKPKLSQSELKVDATTRAARAIINEEANARDVKTERLRAARMARQATEGVPVQKISAKKPTRRKR